MNILMVNSEESCFNDVISSLTNAGCTMTFMDAPAELNEVFVADFLSKVKTVLPDYVLSLGFYPHISNACGIMNLKYVAWIVSGYDPANYDPSIKNEWNILFSADCSLLNEFENFGVHKRSDFKADPGDFYKILKKDKRVFHFHIPIELLFTGNYLS